MLGEGFSEYNVDSKKQGQHSRGYTSQEICGSVDGKHQEKTHRGTTAALVREDRVQFPVGGHGK